MSDHKGEGPGPLKPVYTWEFRLPNGKLPTLADWEELILFLFLTLDEL